MAVTPEEIKGAVARGWCTPENEHKEMDTELAFAIADEILDLLLADRTPYLGCATTLELIIELHARAEVSTVIGEEWPSYRTVD